MTVTTRPGLAFSPAPVVFRGAVGFRPGAQNLDTMPDDQHLLILVNPGGKGNDPDHEVQVVLNFADELKHRVTAR